MSSPTRHTLATLNRGANEFRRNSQVRPWVAPKQGKPFAPTGVEVGATIGIVRHCAERPTVYRAQVWSLAPGRAVWAVDEDTSRPVRVCLHEHDGSDSRRGWCGEWHAVPLDVDAVQLPFVA